MRLCSFSVDNYVSYGLVEGTGIIDLRRHFADSTLRDFISSGIGRAQALAGSKANFSLSQVVLDPVIPNPDKIFCVGLNYHDHIAETGRDETSNPVLFSRFSGSQVGHEQPLVKPLESDQFDYEGELAVVIGKECRRVPESQALEMVAGYSCYNDGSVRDWQLHTHQFLPGKTFAHTGSFGPCLVTTDEIPDPAQLVLETRLNGKVMQRASTALLIASVQRLITYCSTILRLLPGDVIVTGTPGGVGGKRNPPVFLKEGDICEIEISGIGVLRNPVVSEKPVGTAG